MIGLQNCFQLNKLQQHGLALLLLLGLLAPQFSLAKQANELPDAVCKIEDSECLAAADWRFSLAWGYGVRTNPLKHADNIPLVLVPRVQLEYQNFFIDNLDIGYALTKDSDSGLVALLTPNTDGFLFNQSHFLSALATPLPTGQDGGVGIGGDHGDLIRFDDVDRQFSYYMGLEWHKKINRHKLVLQSLYDISDVHQGAEVRFSYSYNHQRNTSKGKNFYFTPKFGMTWRSAKLNNYYYGVDESDLNVIRDVDGSSLQNLLYQAGSGINFRLGFDLVTPVTDQTAFLLKLGVETLSSSISKSPLVGNDVIFTGFIGALTRF